ncbi:MAG TPA: trypsin-like peptidase domain-containing protein [Planctomycetota bacterium]|nr:trypsin-like peptidase domain-containing protein [Planctomycetota bacterium]
MRIEVSQLDGSGATWTLDGPVVRVGAAENMEVNLPLPGVLPLHAVLVLDEGAAQVRPQGRVLLNGYPASDAALNDGDVLELGEGVRLRVRFAVREAQPPFGPTRLLHGRAGAVLTCLFLAIVVGGAYLAARARPEDEGDAVAARLAGERMRQDSLRAAHERDQRERIATLSREIRGLEGRMAEKDDVDSRIGEVERAMQEMGTSVLERVSTEVDASIERHPELKAAQDAVQKIEERDAAAARIIETHARSVCLIQGSYGFARKDADGKWRFLREAEPDLVKDLQLEGDKVPLTLAGKGPVFTVEYTGTGFVVDPKGIVLTNRHIAQPWWKNDSATPLIDDGYQPRFVQLRAYFPGRKEAVDFDLSRLLVSADADLAALRLTPFEGMPPALPLAPKDSIVAGQKVLLLGYPSGLDALLARGEEDLAIQVSGDVGSDAGQLLDALAAKGLVRPLPTQGHIGDVLDDKILFDAPTAVGGSGGPLVDMEGRVVAVNYGILKAFSGANFGVPVSRAEALLARARSK